MSHREALGDKFSALVVSWPAWAKPLANLGIFLSNENNNRPELSILEVPVANWAAPYIAAASAASTMHRCSALTIDDEPAYWPPTGPISFVSTHKLHDAAGILEEDGILKFSGSQVSFRGWKSSIVPLTDEIYTATSRRSSQNLEVSQIVETFSLGVDEPANVVGNWERRFSAAAATPTVLVSTHDRNAMLQKQLDFMEVNQALGPVANTTALNGYGRFVLFSTVDPAGLPRAILTIIDGHVKGSTFWHSAPRPVLIIVDRRSPQAVEFMLRFEERKFATPANKIADDLTSIGARLICSTPETASRVVFGGDAGADPL